MRLLHTTVRALSAAVALGIASIAASGCTDQTLLEPSRRPDAANLALSSSDIENRYIVLFRRDVERPVALAESLVTAHGGVLFHTYEHAVKGFAAANLSALAVQALKLHPSIVLVAEDHCLITPKCSHFR